MRTFLNGTNNKPFQVTNLLFDTPCRSMASTDHSLTIAASIIIPAGNVFKSMRLKKPLNSPTKEDF